MFALACLLLAAVAATALGGSRGGVDRSFGNRGVLRLDSLLREDRYGFISQMAVGPDRSIYLLETDTVCPDACFREYRLFRLFPDGTQDTSYGEGGAAVVVGNVPQSFRAPALSVDPAGRAVVAIAPEGTVSIFRLTASGSPDPSFGDGGTTTLPCDCGELFPGIRFDNRGGILLGGGFAREDYQSLSGVAESKLWAIRLTPRGWPDPRFGGGGRVESMRSNGEGTPARSLLRGGSLLLGGKEESSAGIYLTRITPRGKIDHRFGARLGRSLRALGLPPGARPAAVGGIAPRPRGAVDVFGRSASGGYVLRVRRDGTLDRRFSKDGFKRVPWRITDAIPAVSGRIVATSRRRDGGGLEALVLRRDGRLDRSAGGHPVVLKDWRLSSSLEMAMQGRRPLIFAAGESFCRTYCPSEPKLVRLKALR
jgi:uncharacterized delta-60 repeat protein